LGRFYGVDPFIQFPSNSQSLNPYSYLMNNPLSGTDPTGYCGKRIVGRTAVGCSSFGKPEGNSGRVGDIVPTPGKAQRRVELPDGSIGYVDAKRVASNGANGVPNTKPATTAPSDIAPPSSRPQMEKPLAVQVVTVIGNVLQFAFEHGPDIGADVSGLTDGVEAVKAGIGSANALSEGDNARAVESGAKAGGTLLAAVLLGKVDKIGDAVRGLRGAVRDAGTLFLNKAGKFYPSIPDIRTGRSIAFPIGNLSRVAAADRVQQESVTGLGRNTHGSWRGLS